MGVVSSVTAWRAVVVATAVTTFSNRTEAERFVGETLRRNAAGIWRWLHGRSEHPLPVSARFGEPTGRAMFSQKSAAETVHGVRVVLVKDGRAPMGYRIKTAYPER